MIQDELRDLEERTARVVLHKRPEARHYSLAALMNWLVYGRWPGEDAKQVKYDNNV